MCITVLSFVIPTYHEVKNLPVLLEKIAQVMSTVHNITYEVLIMDDVSQDGSEEVVQQYSASMPVEIMVRHNKVRGLSEAVIDGLYQAKGDYLLVMDADLSHPVSEVPAMLESLQKGDSDFVIGSRYVENASLPYDWGFMRWLNSWIATLLARPLVKISDPMSGFFVFCKKDLPALSILNPIGYKIALEILIKGKFKRVYEHPIGFQDRTQGESKLNLKEQLNYLRHLRRLYQYKWSTWAELLQFGTIGSIGFIIDLSCYYFFQSLGMSHQIARAFSFWPAVTSNWLLNRTITFNHRNQHKPLKQWLSFVFSSSMGFMINWGSYVMLTSYVEFFAHYKILALLTGVVLGMGFNFTCANLFVFHNLRAEKGVQKVKNNSQED